MGQKKQNITGSKNIPTEVRKRKCYGLGCMSSAGVEKLVAIEWILNADGYINILHGYLQRSVENLGIEDSFLFQQNNDPKHVVCKTMA